MTKQMVRCHICKSPLGMVHGCDVEDVLSSHIIQEHTQIAKQITDIALTIEDYEAQFKKLSGMSVRDAIHDFANQNTMRRLGWSEKEIAKYLKGE